MRDSAASSRRDWRRGLLWRWVSEDSGQDLIEYALLTGIVAATSVAVYAVLGTRMGAAYSGWTGPTGPRSIQENWAPPEPGQPGS